jgi:hypothetical protein
MLFPTVHRQASARNGAAIELVQQDPLSVGVELAGMAGRYAIICVAGVAGLVCEEVDVVSFEAAEFIAEGLEKNCPTPNSTTTIILFVLFTIGIRLHKIERTDDVLHHGIYLILIEWLQII